MTHARDVRRGSLFISGLLLSAGMALQACSGGGSDQAPVVEKSPVSAAIGSPAALFIATDATPISGAERKKSLKKVEQDGRIEDVDFHDEDGERLEVEVTRLEYLGEGYFALVLSFDHETADWPDIVLLRASDGKLFDIAGFSLDGLHVKDGYLFAMSRYLCPPTYTSYTLYRVELATMLATPINNPAYDEFPDASASYIVDADFDLRIEPSGWEGRIFFFDNAPPVADSWRHPRSKFCNAGGLSDELATVYGDDGVIYAVCVDDVPDPIDSSKRYLEYGVRSIDFTAAGTVRSAPTGVRTVTCNGACPESLIAPTTPYRLHSRSRYLPVTTGFFKMSPVPAGGIDLAWTGKVLPAITLISGSHGYWKEGDSIYRLRFSADSTSELVVTASNIIGFKAPGGVLIFTKYITGTTIGTYAVCTPGAAPVLLMTEDMEVQQIVELEL